MNPFIRQQSKPAKNMSKNKEGLLIKQKSSVTAFKVEPKNKKIKNGIKSIFQHS